MRRVESAAPGGAGDIPPPQTLLEELPGIKIFARNHLAKRRELKPMLFCKRSDGENWQGELELGTLDLVDSMFESIYAGFESGTLTEYVVVADGRDLMLTEAPYIIVYYGSMENNMRLGCSYEFKGEVLYYSDWSEL